jgi:hypothetical protein
LREELASLRNQGGLPKEDKLYLDDLVTNGDFSNGLTGWTSQVSGFVYSNGEVVGTSANGLYPQIRQTLKTTLGKTYRLNIGKVQLNSGFWIRVRLAHGGTTDTVIQNNSSTPDQNMSGDEGTAFFTARDSEVILILEVRDGAVGTFDNVSVQEVGENLVTNGTFDNGTTGWTLHESPSISVVNGAIRVTNVGSNYSKIETTIPTVAGKTYTVNFDYVGGTSTQHNVRVGSGSTGANLYPNTSVSTGNNTISFTAIDSTSFLCFVNNNVDGAYNDWDNIIVTEGAHEVIQSIPHGYDVKDVYIDGELAREGEAYDYEVKTDGINQWLKPSVEPTATTETVVIGVRK